MTQLVEEAADVLERRVFFDQLSARYEELHADAGRWRQIETERTVETGRCVTARREPSPE